MYLTRGQPVVYYGDEQGFSAPRGVAAGSATSDAREDMFPSQVDLYNDFDLIGNDATTADSNFDPRHPLYRAIGGLAALRERYPALADGAQVHRYASDEAGIYAFSRVSRRAGASTSSRSTTPPTARRSTPSRPARPTARIFPRVVAGGSGAAAQRRRGSRRPHGPRASAVRVACRPPAPRPPRPRRRSAFESPTAGGIVGGRAEIGVSVPGGELQPGDARLAARRRDGLARPRHRRQRAVPRLPRRLGAARRARPWSTAPSLRDATATSAVASTYATVGTTRRTADAGAEAATARSPSRRGLRARHLHRRDRLPGRLDAGLRAGVRPVPGRRRPGLDAHVRRSGDPGRPTPTRRRSTARGTRTTAPAACAAAPTSPSTRTGGPGDLLLHHPTHWVTNRHRQAPICHRGRQLPVRARLPGRTGRRTACGPGCRTPTATARGRSGRRRCRPAATRSRSPRTSRGTSNCGAGACRDGPNIGFAVPAGRACRFSLTTRPPTS